MTKTPNNKRYKLMLDTVDVEEFRVAISKSVYCAVKHTGRCEALVKRFADHHDIPYTNRKPRLSSIPENTKQHIATLYTYSLYGKRKICKLFNVSPHHLKLILLEYDAHKLVTDSKRDEFLRYAKLVRRLSAVTKRFFNLESPKGEHWDHRISIVDGFINQIPPYLIAARENFELLPITENLQKGIKSSISVDVLYKELGI